MDGEDKSMELMERLNDSFATDPDMRSARNPRGDERDDGPRPTIGPEATGRFGIGPKRLA